MQRVLEILFGLERGFLSNEGDLGVAFNARWPLQEYVGAGVWNAVLIALAAWLVVYVYRREGRTRNVRVGLGAIRALLLALVILLLNRPILTLTQSRAEPSVLAVMVDDSISMRVNDGGTVESPRTRLEQAIALLDDPRKSLLRDLAAKHDLRIYRFNRNAAPIGTVTGVDPTQQGRGRAIQVDTSGASTALRELQPVGDTTKVAASLISVAQDLQGQRLAGIVVVTDGRDTPTAPATETITALKNFGVKVYPVAVGSDRDPMNIELQSVSAQETAFKDDIVNVRVNLRGRGTAASHPVSLVLKNKKTGDVLLNADGSEVRVEAALAGDAPVDAELQFKPTEVGALDLIVEAVPEAGELDLEDNSRAIQVAVLDTKINVLYVDGYPRWEYRYLKNEMIRDRTVDISCLLTSADINFAQEGDRPITRFPESIEEILDYDVVVIGDVDPRYFTDAQLSLIHEFVSRKGGGLAMVSGPRWAPQAYKNTPIEAILPVSIGRMQSEEPGPIKTGFRPVLTRDGTESSIFRFFTDRAENERYFKEHIPELYWYARGAVIKQGVGEVYAEHPNDVGPDGRKVPLLVLGRFGAGRTLYSAIDDSWRWRFYTGESVFDTYWIQQLRYLARSRKLGQRRLSFSSARPAYELGEQVRLSLRILDPQLMPQLPDQLRVELLDDANQPIRQESLLRQEGQPDLFSGSFTADRIGRFSARLAPVAGGVDETTVPVEVIVPRLELAEPRVDRTTLSRLASETMGESVAAAEAGMKLPGLIPSAARVIPVQTSSAIWNAPIAMGLFVLLITAEWVVRKLNGMV